MKNITFILLFICFKTFSQSVSQTMLRLPDTGETTGYTNTFGEDADYTINAPYFTINGDGTVTDTITGLIWQQTDGGEMTIENAVIYCDTLTLGGYTNWRLPNAHEGFSILNHQQANPALNSAVFTTTAADYWWTGDFQVNDASKVWATNAGGGVGNHPKTETISAGGNKHFHVRAVRDVITPPILPAQFTDNGNGTITDNLTNLIWQKAPFADSITWEQALGYADTLTLAGATDWRLPNIKEMQSVNDESIITPSVSISYFPSIGVKKYWSSTTLPNQTAKAWYLDTHFGITTYANKTAKNSVLCVKNNTGTPTGLTENKVGKTIVYPNPFTSQINVNTSGKNIAVKLYNTYGQLIYAGSSIQQYDFSLLPNGLYYLKVEGTNPETIKLVKE